MRWETKLWRLSVLGSALFIVVRQFDDTLRTLTKIDGRVVDQLMTQPSNEGDRQRTPSTKSCAIALWGLPRAFKSLALPSIEKNVIAPNLKYGCDYFVHYYHQQQEGSGRAGGGGDIHPDDIFLLRDSVHRMAQEQGGLPLPAVSFCNDTEEEFWEQHTPLIDKIRNTKDQNGKYLYFPWKARTYRHPETTDNIIKMWHTIQRSFELMKSSEAQLQRKYARVAMIRSDMVYVTPLDVHTSPNGTDTTDNNRFSILPNFAKYPVNDRMVIGPVDAVEIWATTRFSRLETHVNWTLYNDPGRALHSEMFVNRSLLPAMREIGSEIYEDPRICFLRARADQTVWIADCGRKPSQLKGKGNVQRVVERVLGRNCGNQSRVPGRKRVITLNCSEL